MSKATCPDHGKVYLINPGPEGKTNCPECHIEALELQLKSARKVIEDCADDRIDVISKEDIARKWIEENSDG